MPGALVLSLDFELHWGVRDHVTLDAPYAANLRGARDAIPMMLDTVSAYEVACTWATVGMLFARSRAELEAMHPARRPRYVDARLDPYGEPVGDDEARDPMHFAPSLVASIRATPRQEIATHTYSHYYCLEPGQDEAAFAADLDAAVASAALHGVRLRSIVYPRNQRNAAYDRLLRAAGIVAYRGQPRGWVHTPRGGGATTLPVRALRLAEAYAPAGPSYLVRWDEVAQPSGLCDVRASFFVRPLREGTGMHAIERARVSRLRRAIVRAGRERRIVHLWWHPHNFGVRTEANIAMLRALLDTFVECRERYGMESLSMAEVADRAMAVPVA